MNSVDLTAIIDRIGNGLVSSSRAALPTNFISSSSSSLLRIEEAADLLYHFQTKMLAIVRRNVKDAHSFEIAELGLVNNTVESTISSCATWSELDKRLMGDFFTAEFLHSGEKTKLPLLTPLIWLNTHRNNLPKKLDIYTDEIDGNGNRISETVVPDDVVMFSTDKRPDFGIITAIYHRDHRHWFELKSVLTSRVLHVESHRCALASKAVVDDLMVRKLKK